MNTIQKLGAILLILSLILAVSGAVGWSDACRAKAATDDYASVYVYATEVDGLFKVEKDGKYGFVNTSGELVTPCELLVVENFIDGFARVAQDGKFGFVNTSGELAIPCQWDDAWDFNNGLAVVEKNGKVGVIDKTGKQVVACAYDNAKLVCSGGYIVLIEDDGVYIYDAQ